MYAIVDIAGQQFKVEAGKEIFVNRTKTRRIDNERGLASSYRACPLFVLKEPVSGLLAWKSVSGNLPGSKRGIPF